MRSSVLTASHLEAGEVVGRFLKVEGLSVEFDKEEGPVEAYCAKWVSGGGRLSSLFRKKDDPVTHELVVRGMRRLEATLQCRPNIGKPGALPFVEMDGAPSFVVEAEKRAASFDRLEWGARLGGGPQLEVTVFACRGIIEKEGGPLQLIARSLCVDSKPYAKLLAPVLYERRGEFFQVSETKAEQLARDWARAAARSPAFFDGYLHDIASGVDWVRRKVLDEKITNPDVAAEKAKVKLTARGDRAACFLDEKTNAAKQGLSSLEPRRLVFRARSKGTRLKLELKRRGGGVKKNTQNLGRLDVVVDDFVKKNAQYPTGWLPLTHGAGELQIRLYLLDPNALLPNVDDDDDKDNKETPPANSDVATPATAPVVEKTEIKPKPPPPAVVDEAVEPKPEPQPEAAGEPAAPAPVVDDDDQKQHLVAAKFEKMLKMGLPRGAVEQKMRAEGVDPGLLDGGDASASASATASASASASAGRRQQVAKYEKMLKMGLPRGAVEQKMRAEGVDPGLLDGNNNNNSGLPSGAVMKSNSKRLSRRPQSTIRIYGAAPRIPLRAWYWHALRDETPKRAVWSTANALQESLNLETSGIETAFAKQQPGAKDPAAAAKKAPSEAQKPQSFVDPRTEQNCGIVLKKLKLPARTIASFVYSGDRRAMTLGRVEILSKAKPTDEILNAALERDDLDDQNDDPTVTSTSTTSSPSQGGGSLVEVFFRAASLVPRYADRLDALLLSHTFDGLSFDLDVGLTSVGKACDVEENADLSLALAACLRVGNYLNGGTPRGDAKAFALGGLARLATTKSNDGATTLAHHVALVVEARDVSAFDRLQALKSHVLDPAASANLPGTWDADLADLDARVKRLERLLEDDDKAILDEADDDDDVLVQNGGGGNLLGNILGGGRRRSSSKTTTPGKSSRLKRGRRPSAAVQGGGDVHHLTAITENDDDPAPEPGGGGSGGVDDEDDDGLNDHESDGSDFDSDDDDGHADRRAFRVSMEAFATESRRRVDALKQRRRALDSRLQSCAESFGETSASPKELFEDYIGAFIRAICKAHKANEQRKLDDLQRHHQPRRRRTSPPPSTITDLFNAFSATQTREDKVLDEFHARQARRQHIAPDD